jgi:ABC-2 type transport system ATP-binding protein
MRQRAEVFMTEQIQTFPSQPDRPAAAAGDRMATIEVSGLSKRYGAKTAVDDLSFTVQPGTITGFLGPNGAGKSTTMRLILGLDRPSAGTATIGGKPYRDLVEPLRVVGALLEARAVHSGRSAYNHLLVLAQTQGIARARVEEVIGLVGLHDVAHDRVGSFSLGMGQRLGIAAALLGEPQVLVLDEPINGLDPDGIVWIRNLLKHLAAQGATVFISSHLMSEMAVTAEHLIVIGRGRLIADCTTDEFIARSSDKSVLVKSPDTVRLGELITADGGRFTAGDDGEITVTGLPAPRIGELAAAKGLVLHELTPQLASLEEAFMELTHGSVEYATPAGLATGNVPDQQVTR